MIYGTLSESKTYHADRGNTAWAGADDSALSKALLRGSEFIDNEYRDGFPGCKVGGRDQVREWPRNDAYDYENDIIPFDTVPIEVQRATYEAALRELESPGSLQPDFVPATQLKKASVDGAVSVEYVSVVGAASAQPIITIVSGILRPILTGTGHSSIVGSLARS